MRQTTPLPAWGNVDRVEKTGWVPVSTPVADRYALPAPSCPCAGCGLRHGTPPLRGAPTAPGHAWQRLHTTPLRCDSPSRLTPQQTASRIRISPALHRKGGLGSRQNLHASLSREALCCFVHAVNATVVGALQTESSYRIRAKACLCCMPRGNLKPRHPGLVLWFDFIKF